MGMFTTIVDPRTKREYQIKSGYDNCETYTVGDKVDQWINPNTPNSGRLLDDVYDGVDYDNTTKTRYQTWIIIKDGYVAAIEDWDHERGYADYDTLREKYQIKDLPRETWSEAVWQEQEERQKRSDEDHEEFMKSIAHLPPEQRFAMIFARPLMRKMNCESFARQIFKIETLDIEVK